MMEFGDVSPRFVNHDDADGEEKGVPDSEEEEGGLLGEGLDEGEESEDPELLPEE